MGKYRKSLTVIVCILITLTVGFIFGNSIISAESSNEMSNSIVDSIGNKIPLHSDVIENKTGFTIQYLARKFAHYAEFFALGAALLILKVLLPAKSKGKSIFMPLFICLFTAVTDEFIQKLCNRTSLVPDVVLDFSGSVCGMLAAFLIVSLVCLIAKKKQKQ